MYPAMYYVSGSCLGIQRLNSCFVTLLGQSKHPALPESPLESDNISSLAILQVIPLKFSREII